MGGHYVHFPVLVYCTNKNLATLIGFPLNNCSPIGTFITSTKFGNQVWIFVTVTTRLDDFSHIECQFMYFG
jgi:hypothetical protein